MKTLSVLLLFTGSILLAGCGTLKNREITVITFNIRYDNPRDSVNAWTNRKALVCDFFKTEKPDLFGLQEALWYQYEAVDSALAGYGSVAVGRDDGKKKGEMNPVFYNTARFEYLADSTFWLSKTPGKAGSKAWNSSLPRIVSWVKLKDKNSGKTIYYFNTHFAHDSDTARIMSARLLLREIRRIAGRERFILTGDFNTNPETRAYSVLTGSVKGKPLLVDSYSISETPPSGPAGTFNGWSDTPREGRIDYIFVKRGSSVKSLTTVLKKEGSVFISDHWPVKAVVIPE